MLLSEDDPKLLVHAHADGELDPANARAIERSSISPRTISL
jgi:anti-sigma factor RsiW